MPPIDEIHLRGPAGHLKCFNEGSQRLMRASFEADNVSCNKLGHQPKSSDF